MVDPNWNSDDANLTGNRNTVPVDPRLDWTVGRDSVPFKDWGLFSIKGGWVRDIGNGGPYSPKKNAHEKASGAESTVGWQNTQLNSVKIHLFRYADLLLMLAESYVEANRLPEAMAIVNQIRTRAAQTAQGCGTTAIAAKYPLCANDTRMAVPINDPVTAQWATYKIGNYTSFPDQNYARDAVRAERRIELAMEGQRFFDMRQYGQQYVSSFITSFLTKEGTAARRQFLSGAETFGAKHMLYPIPQLQIDLSKVNGVPALKQNTGW